MDVKNKIIECQSILVENLGSEIKSMFLNKRGKELKLSLINGIKIYIVYNNYNIHTRFCSLIRSMTELDTIILMIDGI